MGETDGKKKTNWNPFDAVEYLLNTAKEKYGISKKEIEYKGGRPGGFESTYGSFDIRSATRNEWFFYLAVYLNENYSLLDGFEATKLFQPKLEIILCKKPKNTIILGSPKIEILERRVKNVGPIASHETKEYKKNYNLFPSFVKGESYKNVIDKILKLYGGKELSDKVGGK